MSPSSRLKSIHERPVIGSWINSLSPVLAELMAGAGFDFLTLDAEHSPLDVPQAFALLQAIRSGNPNCAALVRLPGNDYAETKRYLDAGADGVIVPLVRTAEEAREIVRAVKYPPVGDRGVGFCRDNLYGRSLGETVAQANENTFLCVQIEHAESVENIDAILGIAGVDAAFIGPYDLSASMGITAQFDHSDYLEAERRILEGCRRHGVAAGIHVVPPEPGLVLQRIAEGYRLIAYSLDITMVSEASAKLMRALHAEQG
jgi:2-dehydro-3-deoxyglucarate aldolase